MAAINPPPPTRRPPTRNQAQRLRPQGEGTPTAEVRADGANIIYHIVAGWGPTYDPDKAYALIYEVHGGEDGPVRNYMATTGDHHRKVENDQFLSTLHVDQRLIVKAVAVEELAGAMFTPRSCQPH